MYLRVRAPETVLTRKGYVDPAALDALVDTYQTQVGPRNGARVVAKAWVDPVFREWLLRDGHHRIAGLRRTPRRTHGGAAEHPFATPHGRLHLVQLLPLARAGFAARLVQECPHRARAVREPRRVLAEFGVSLPESTEIRVWDSTAEVRYLVLSMRPGAWFTSG